MQSTPTTSDISRLRGHWVKTLSVHFGNWSMPCVDQLPNTVQAFNIVNLDSHCIKFCYILLQATFTDVGNTVRDDKVISSVNLIQKLFIAFEE